MEYVTAKNKEISVGFTGSRKGMTKKQRSRLRKILSNYVEEYTVTFRHGDCIGADEQAHKIAKNLGCRIVIHPPIDDKQRAYKKGNKTLKPKKYLERNKDIVNNSDKIIACPEDELQHNKN